MKYAFSRTIVIALGGSIVHPDGIDTAFLKKWKTLIPKFLPEHRFVLAVGGGRLSRAFQEAAEKVTKVTDEDKDWLGIHATRMNAHLLRTLFRDVADPVVIDARHRLHTLSHPVTIASGWRPGWSTDYIAVALAQDFGAAEVVIAGKPAYVYDRDPSEFGSALPLSSISWKDYAKLVPQKWSPGLHAPVDPVAAKLAERQGIKAIVVGGQDLTNFGNMLKGKPFKGTIVG